MRPLYEDPCFAFRFPDDRIIPRFHLEGVEARRRVEVYKIDPGTGERLRLLAKATVGEGGWVDLPELIIVRPGDTFIVVPEPVGRANERRVCRVSINTSYVEMARTLGTPEGFWRRFRQ